MDNRQKLVRLVSDVRLWSAYVLSTPLYRYQQDIADYIVNMAGGNGSAGAVCVVEMPRQSGKNELSSHIESLLLSRYSSRGGALVKAAPTWTPQIVNSKMRLDLHLGSVAEKLPIVKGTKEGYIVTVGRAMIQFLSAKPTSSVVGATANVLMEIDEAQDVQSSKYDKDFAPMRASRGCPVVFYGTTWTGDTLLEQQKAFLAEGGFGRYFRISPERVMEENPAYSAFLEGEIRRLGREHPLIKTQYFLEPLANKGLFLSEQQVRLLAGEHARRDRRTTEQWIVAGLDFAGADETVGMPLETTYQKRDSVALTIAMAEEVRLMAGLSAVRVRFLERYEWTNVPIASLHGVLFEILEGRWQVDRLHCDATGIGEASTSFLATALRGRGDDRVGAIHFDGAWTTSTRLAFNYLMLVNTGMIFDYRPDGFSVEDIGEMSEAPSSNVAQHAWYQRVKAKMTAKPGQRVKVFVDEKDGHDDLLMSELLCVDAAIRLLGGPDALGVAGVG